MLRHGLGGIEDTGAVDGATGLMPSPWTSMSNSVSLSAAAGGSAPAHPRAARGCASSVSLDRATRSSLCADAQSNFPSPDKPYNEFPVANRLGVQLSV